MAQRYDHPNVLVTRERELGVTVAGTTNPTTFRLGKQKKRLKSITLNPETVGTADAYVGPIRTIIATTTASIGAGTIGTVAVNLVASRVAILVGTGNTPPGIDVDADSLLTFTSIGDATGVVRVELEYEILPDAVQT